MTLLFSPLLPRRSAPREMPGRGLGARGQGPVRGGNARGLDGGALSNVYGAAGWALVSKKRSMTRKGGR